MRARLRRCRAGLMMLDVLAGLALLAALASALAVMSHAQQRTAAQLQDQRAAVQCAQQVLSNLQSTGKATCSDAEASVAVSPGGGKIGELEWATVTVMKDGRRADLVGLARGSAGGAQ